MAGELDLRENALSSLDEYRLDAIHALLVDCVSLDVLDDTDATAEEKV